MENLHDFINNKQKVTIKSDLQDDDNLVSQTPKISDLTVHVQDNPYSYFINFFLIGMMNNIGFSLIMTSSSNVVNKFDMRSYLGSFLFCLTLFSVMARIINGKYMLNFTHRTRIQGMIYFSIMSYSLMSIANTTNQIWGFYVSLVGSCIQGICCSFGESVILGFAKEFPSIVVSSFSAGTGMAGIVGSGIYVLLQTINFPDQHLFMIALPCVCFTYWKCFCHLDDFRLQFNEYDQKTHLIKSYKNSIEIEQKKNVSLKFQNVLNIYPQMRYFCFNLGSVYFFEYVITGGFAEYAVKIHQDDNFYKKNSFEILQLCYQIGVLISRSSLALVKVKHLEILTFFQLINFILWFYIAYDHFGSLLFYFILMIWTGLMGGASYVNTNYQILNSIQLKNNQKELGITISCIFNDSAIFLASIFSIIVANTIFKDQN